MGLKERKEQTLRARRARAQRGAAVFIVVLVITMLTGIGVFAVRSSILATTASGYDRQMIQTHYITEYAVLAAASELSTDRRDAYVRRMTKLDDCPNFTDCKCKSIKGASALISNSTCYIFGYGDLEAQLGTSNKFVTPTDNSDPSNKIPGSLGHGDLSADFRVEMTDLAPADRPIAGHDPNNQAVALQFVSVTLNAVGHVRPGGGSDKAAASMEQARAHLIVGPLPKQ